jgi:hypothetical protein
MGPEVIMLRPILAPAFLALALALLAADIATAQRGGGPNSRRAASPSECVNGYRTTHRVRSGDRTSSGVILRCRN